MGDKSEFGQDVVERLTRIEKLLHESLSRNINRTPADATYENKKNAYLTKLDNNEILQPKPTTLEYYKIKYDEETKIYS